jgi:predicted MPP superfamily phosphohydrolase
VTPERYWTAVVLFHVGLLLITWRVAARWRDSRHRTLPARAWLGALARDIATLGVLAWVLSFVAPAITNVSELARAPLGAISGRLMGQALFGEGVAVAALLAAWHRNAAPRWRAVALGLASLGLLGVAVDAYSVEPRMLRVRRYVVDRTGGNDPRTIRILHVTDIQTARVGAHEERALRAGLACRPDLIVLTGDYVQDELGRPTEDQAAHDLAALMERIGFQAPLGTFATEGDTGPDCAVVFSGVPVRCLVDATAVVAVPGAGRLAITGLSRNRGRERDPRWLERLLNASPDAEHRIVISHAPDFVDALPWPVDLVLAGHTHGGQVVVPLLGPPRTAIRLSRRYAGGLNDFDGTPLHVSRGVGMERGFTVPVRFLCPPEIGVLDLRIPSATPPNDRSVAQPTP